ncbi:MAG: cob(I)yrinic acid a,c-diamide adenosyltransferase [Bacteroidetes bacterium]|nr:cob(I)yrinic acid a,c-diamide adenosyltransferase [Bacteroidota bacterium]
MKIYTKKGDKGETSLIGGVKIKKSDLRIEAYGTVDELNSWVGVIKNIKEINNDNILENIQRNLFTIGSHLASHPEKSKMKLPEINISDVVEMENEIDRMEAELPELRNFILPGSSVENGYCNVARSVCRRAERCVVKLSINSVVDNIIVIYLNRLSDYLFVLSRYITFKQGDVDIKWV